MVWNRTSSAMDFVPPALKAWDNLFYMYEGDLTWRNSPIALHVIPFAFSAAYILMVYQLPPFLMSRKALRQKISANMRPWMMGWNLFLSGLSLLMFTGLVVPSFYFVRSEGFWHFLCNTSENAFPPFGSYVLWTALFGYSKFFELVDTLLLILKNPERPIPFLHWYHHFSVLIFCWYAANWKLSVGLCFAIINSLVHTFMYWYYFQKERGYDPWWAKPLTVAQILQMVIGLILNSVWFYGWYNGQDCACTRPRTLIAMGVTIYASYLFLFMKYFLQRYVFTKKPAAGKGKQPQKKDQTKVKKEQ